MPKYNHAFTIGFEVVSRLESGHDVTGSQLREAIESRLKRLTDDEILETCDSPYDTYEIEEEKNV